MNKVALLENENQEKCRRRKKKEQKNIHKELFYRCKLQCLCEGRCAARLLKECPHCHSVLKSTCSKMAFRIDDPMLYAAKLLNHFLVDEDGQVKSLLMECLQPKVGSGNDLKATPKHLPDIDNFPVKKYYMWSVRSNSKRTRFRDLHRFCI